MTKIIEKMASKQRKQAHAVINTVANTLGLSLLTTATAVTAHHLWRKRTNPNAKLSDYVNGVNEQIKRIEQANQSWLTTYKNLQDKGSQDVSVSAGLTDSQPMFLKTVEWVSGVANKSSGSEFDDFSVVGIDKNRQIVWQTPVPERVHDIVVQPPPPNLPLSSGRKQSIQNRKRDVAVMGRRPSEYFWIMDCATGELIHTIKAKKDRHFYGHACYSLDGSLLYVTENDTSTYHGMIGVYEVANGYRKINEFATHGIGPHEVILHPDGDKLIIANGGIKTERASREELNIDSMQPSLVYVSLKQGEEGKVLQQLEPSHNQMSVRHLSVINSDSLKGTVAIGIQFQGEKHLNMPLVLTHQFGDDEFEVYTPTTDWRQFHHYIASIMVNANSNLICATSPIGGCVSVFDMTTQTMLDTIKIADCAGIAVADDGFIVSDGQGSLTLLTASDGKVVADTVTLPMAFDNHLQKVV